MKYDEELSEFWNSDTYTQFGGFTYFDESKRGILMRNLRMTDFQSLYPTLLVDLYKRGYKVEGIDDKYQRIIYLLSKSKSELSMGEIVELNSFYMKIHKFSEIGKKLSNMVTFYARLIMQEMLELNKKNIIYIDTCYIIHQDDLDFGDIRFKIIETNIEYLKIVRNKKIVYLSENKMKLLGFPKSLRFRKDIEEVNLITSEIKSQRRADRLSKLGIF